MTTRKNTIHKHNKTTFTHQYIYDNDGTIIDPHFSEWVEIDVSEDEDIDEIVERLNDGDGKRFQIVKGRVV